jgi:HEAT repeat protein
MAETDAKPRRTGWRRFLPWLGALVLLGLAAAFFGGVVKPLLDVHEAALYVRDNCTSEGFRKALAGLGGPRKAARKIGLYCGTSRKIAPEREWATYLLGDCGPEAVPRLLPLVGDEDAAVRVAAISSLGHLKERRAVDPLIVALCGSDEAVRVSAARALGRIGDSRAVGPLAAQLGAREVAVRSAAAGALGRTGGAGAVDPLVAALRDESLLVRETAARSLGALADARALPALEALAAKEGSGSAGAAAREAIEKIRASQEGR